MDTRRRRNTAHPATTRRNVPERILFPLTFSPSLSRSRHVLGDDPAPRGIERHGSLAPAPPQVASRNRNAGGREAGLPGGDHLRSKIDVPPVRAPPPPPAPPPHPAPAQDDLRPADGRRPSVPSGGKTQASCEVQGHQIGPREDHDPPPDRQPLPR